MFNQKVYTYIKFFDDVNIIRARIEINRYDVTFKLCTFYLYFRSKFISVSFLDEVQDLVIEGCLKVRIHNKAKITSKYDVLVIMLFFNFE